MTKMIELAEQQILGFHTAKRGETWSDLVSAMGLTLKEYIKMDEEGMIDYLNEDDKAEIFSAIKN